jgi:hypothetical protein
MDKERHRYAFLSAFFDCYPDFNIDLKMRLFPLSFSDSDYMIEWTDYSKKKILLMVEESINKNGKLTGNGLITYYFKDAVINDVQYTYLQMNFYNAKDSISEFIEIFNNFFNVNLVMSAFKDHLEEITKKKRGSN